VEERTLSLVIDVPADLPTVLADPQELGMAMTHLVDNATKFTGADGHVQITARLVQDAGQPRAVEIAVADDGIGIPAELHARIFDRFYQVDASLARQFGGVGIGLPIVKQILQAHGSSLLVESEPGKGSTFRFRLPLTG
jgi:signal transduction histidine kinase